MALPQTAAQLIGVKSDTDPNIEFFIRPLKLSDRPQWRHHMALAQRRLNDIRNQMNVRRVEIADLFDPQDRESIINISARLQDELSDLDEEEMELFREADQAAILGDKQYESLSVQRSAVLQEGRITKVAFFLAGISIDGEYYASESADEAIHYLDNSVSESDFDKLEDEVNNIVNLSAETVKNSEAAST